MPVSLYSLWRPAVRLRPVRPARPPKDFAAYSVVAYTMSLYGGTGKNSGVGGESGGNDRNGGRSRNDSTASETPGDDYHRQLVDERTRLLPNRIDSPRPRVLSPDDPAVTPYNVWSVRVVRSISIVLLVVTLLWWCLILISAFITPPGLYVRGSPFFAFAFTTVALLDIVTLALFFSAPSRGHRIQGGLLSVSTM